MSQEQAYLATTSTAASTTTPAQWANIGVPDSDQVIGFELEGELTFTPGVPGAVDAPTEAELDALLTLAISNFTVNTKGYGNFQFGNFAELRRLCRLTMGQDIQIQPKALAASGAAFVIRFALRLPQVVPVGREAKPMKDGGRGSRRHCAPGEQYRNGATTISVTTGALGAVTYGGLAGVLAFGGGQQIRCHVITLPTRMPKGARAIPLHMQAVVTQQQNRFMAGLYYTSIVNTAVPDTVGQQNIDVKADETFILDATRVDARVQMNGAVRAWRQLASCHPYRTGTTQAPYCVLHYPDPQSHEPVICNVEFTVGNNSAGGYGLGGGVNTLGLCWAPLQAVDADNTKPATSGPGAPRIPD